MLAAKSASPLICGLSKPVSRSSRSCSITAAMWAMPPVVERMKPSDPVEVEGIHNVSVTLLQILSGGEGPCPFFSAGRRLLMRPHDRGIDHQILVASILGEGAEDPLPDAGGSPTCESFMHGFILAVALRQITPPRPGAQGPEHAVDKAPIVLRGTAYTLFPS